VSQQEPGVSQQEPSLPIGEGERIGNISGQGEIISQTSDRYSSLNLSPYAVCWTIYFGGCSRERSSCGSENQEEKNIR
jgi:hypothetical protein